MNLHVRVSERSLAAAATSIAALSGARMVGNTFDQLWQFAKNLDKSIPVLSAATSAVTLLGQVATTSASNLLSLFASTAQLVPLALTIPGVITGLGIGIGVTVAAMKDFNEVLPEVSKSLDRMQDTLSEKFWDQAAKPMRSLFREVLPRLQKGFDRTAERVGNFTALLAGAFERHADDGAMEVMFRDLGVSIDVAATYADDFADVIFGLGKIGARQLPRLAQWVGDISNGFAGWLAENDANGNIDRWVDRAVRKLNSLGSIVGNVSSILYNLGTAAEAGGGATLEGMAEATGRWAEAVRSPGFQTKMTNFFKAFHDGLDIVRGASGPAFVEWVDSVRVGLMKMSRIMSPSIGKFFDGLFTTLSSPPVVAGWEDLLTGLSTGLAYFGDRLPQMAPGLGAVMGIVGSLAENLLPVLADAFVWLSDVLARVGPDIETVIENFSTQFRTLIDEWGPKVAPIVERISDALAKFSEDPDSLVKAAAAIAGLAVGLKAISSLGSIVGILRGVGAVTSLLSGKGGAAGAATGVGALGRALGLIVTPAGLAAGVIAATGIHLFGLYENSPKAQKAVDDLKASFDYFFDSLAKFEAKAPAIAGAFTGVFGSLKLPDIDFGSIFSSENELAMERFAALAATIDSVFRGMGDTVNALITNLDFSAAIDSALGGLFGPNVYEFSQQALAMGISIGQNVIKGIVQGVSWLAHAPGAAIRTGVQLMIDTAKSILGIHSPSTVFIGIGMNVIQGLINGILSLAGQLPGIMAGIAASLPGAFAGAGTQLTGVGSTLGAALITGFKLVTGQGKTEEAGGGAANGLRRGVEGVDLKPSGTGAIGGFIAGIQARFASAQSAGTTTAEGTKAGAAAVSLATTGQQAIAGFVNAIRAAVTFAKAAGEGIGYAVRAGLLSVDLASPALSAVAAFVRGIVNAAGAARSAASSVAASAASALGGYSGAAYNSGAAISGAFAQGLASRVGAARQAANALAAAARASLPNSPAKQGPFSGSGWGGWGESIGDELAKGLRARQTIVRAAASSMAGMAEGAVGGINLNDLVVRNPVNDPSNTSNPGPLIGSLNMGNGSDATEVVEAILWAQRRSQFQGKYGAAT